MHNSADDPTGTPQEPAAWTRACQQAVTRDDALDLTLYVRSAVPAYGTRAYHDEVRDRVAALAADGPVSSWRREVLGDRLDPAIRTVARASNRAPGDPPTDVGEILAWADRRSLDLPFAERRRQSMLVEESHASLVPPHVLLAVRSGDDVVGVAPCRDRGETTSVIDLLTLLENPERAGDDRPTATA